MDLLLGKSAEGMYGAGLVAEGVAEGSVYTTLARMMDKGFVESRREARKGGPPRRYFSLTGSGERAILLHHRWMDVVAEARVGELEPSWR